MKKWCCLLLALALLSVSLFSCTPAAGPQDPADNQPPAEDVTKTSMTIGADRTAAAVSEEITLTVAGGQTDREAVSFRFSDDDAVSGRKQNGKTIRFRAEKEGELTVTAVCSGEETSCRLVIHSAAAFIPATSPYLFVHGRTATDGTKRVLRNTASGVEITFYGRSLTAYMQNTYGDSAFSVLLDGETDTEADVIRLTTDLDGGKILLAAFDEPGMHTIKLLKRTEESISGAALTAFAVEDGGFLPCKPVYDIAMEVYGDSITCGYGNMRADGQADALNADLQNGLATYATRAAAALNARCNVMAQSGIGLYTNPYSQYTFMKDAYACTSPGTKTAWDFSSYRPDVVVVNIGTNDIWTGAEKGGNPAYTEDAFVSAYITFLENIAARYGGNVPFVLCSGLMETGLASAVSRVAAAMQEKGYTVRTVTFARTKANGHPRLPDHYAAAEQLTAAVREVLAAA